MFQFPGLALPLGVTGLQPAGFPHSDIHGSKPACGSPWLFAACHVLPRLSAPRHPPCALTTLGWCPKKEPKALPLLLQQPNLMYAHHFEIMSVLRAGVGTNPALPRALSQAHLFGARFSSNPPGQTEESLLNLSKPKFSSSKTARAALSSLALTDFVRAKPLKIAKSASPSTPTCRVGRQRNRQQNADQEVPCRDVELPISN